MFKSLIFPILFFLLVLSAGGVSPSSAAEGTFDLEDGFQGYTWGVSPENLEGFRKIGTKNNADFYICPCVTYLIEDITVPRVVYGFVDNQLYGVFIDIENDTVFDKLLAYITDTYGDPELEREAASLIVHRWSVGAVKIKLKDDLAAGERKLSFYYRPLSRQVNLSPFPKTAPEDEPKPLSWTPPMQDEKPVEIPLLSF